MSRPKLETIRCLRLGDFRKLFHYRYRGHVLPDDSAGRDDLWLLVTNASLAVSEPKKKMAHVIELWAPWMPPDEAAAYVRHVEGLDLYQRIQTADELGQRMRVTNAERERLRLWQFKPVDMTQVDLTEQRKAKERARHARLRRAKGMRSREAYLAEMATKSRPWEAAGMSRRTWYRRMARGPHATIVTKRSADLVPLSRGNLRKKGCHGGVLVEVQKAIREVGVVETNEPRSRAVRADLVSTDAPQIDPLIISVEQRERSKKFARDLMRCAIQDWRPPHESPKETSESVRTSS